MASERRPEPVRRTALRLLHQVTHHGGNSSLLLERARFAGNEDRALATTIVLGCLRRLAALDALARPVVSRPLAGLDPLVLTAVRLGIFQLVHLDRVPDYAAVGETVEAIKPAAGRGAAAFVNAVLRGFARKKDAIALPGPEDPGSYLTVTLSLPRFLADRWTSRFGAEGARRLAEAASRPAPVTLRAVLHRETAASIRDGLAGEDVKTAPGRYLEEAIRVEDGGVLASGAFRRGVVFFQDEAAQMVARMVAPRPGERILDACAAPGGKALAIADLALGKALVVAADARVARLKRVRENLERVRLPGIRLLCMDAGVPALVPGFDAILVDAPCTGTGTIGRNPELRYRVDAAGLERSRLRALGLLGGVSSLLRPGGRLVYATCSLEPEENEEVIAWLLAGDPSLALADPRPHLPAPVRPLVGDDLVLRTHPGDPEVDGFTAFLLEKR